MKIRKIFLWIFLCSSVLLNAQSDFRQGFIINNSGDTIYGEIDYRGDVLMGSMCRFKSADSIIEYSPNEILAFRFIDSKFFVARDINGKKVFLEYLLKGKVDVYYLRDYDGDHYYLDKEGIGLSELPYKEEIVRKNGIDYFVKSTNHIGYLKLYMDDISALQSKIEAVKTPKHDNLITLAEDYHKAVCSDESCVIYEKKLPIVKIAMEVAGGGFNYIIDDSYVRNNFYFEGGVLMHIGMPRLNERFYFKTGLLYLPVEGKNGERTTVSKIPLHMEYQAPLQYKVRPFMSIGLLSPSYSAGVYIKAGKKVNIGLQSWLQFDYEQIPWVPSQLKYYSFLGSLYFRL
jgi:hypothetical protein